MIVPDPLSCDESEKSMEATDNSSAVTGEYVRLDGEDYFRIANSHLMDDFFMSLVGASDHWMFVSSKGALTAGRRNPDTALFPYAADDQITAARSHSGSLTTVRTVDSEGNQAVWQPWSADSHSDFRVRQNLYKTPLGNKLVFEEVNDTLGLLLRYRWTFSEKFGFVRSCHLENIGGSELTLELLDGIQNIVPFGAESEFLMRYSNLANAYKKNELVSGSEIGIYYLSSIPSDRAEPSEGLKATTVWQVGLDTDATLISNQQLQAFRRSGTVNTESDVRGKPGAYLVQKTLTLDPGDSQNWHVVAELCQDHAAIVCLDEWLRSASESEVETAIEVDVAASEREFFRIVSFSDGIQLGANRRRCNRHLSNTVFNVMRGGLPLANYDVPTADFRDHVAKFNRPVADRHREFLSGLPATLHAEELRWRVAAQNDPDLTRLGMEYLPLAFSRRHGDPTRPWNRFSIDLRSDDGSSNLNYQGNWRDIFQNWEALGLSFPRFTTAMICRFLNATTADGYNAYRVTKDGFEWEEADPDDPWANIGYWGDHQIIYLLKLLEWNRRFEPQALEGLLNSPLFTHANVPYRIKSFEEIRKNPRDTIVFDHGGAKQIEDRVEAIGADGKLLHDQSDQIHRVTMIEKLLTLSLAKLSNFVPDGGIWLNTQRPEWNDANNALVGNGMSVVTTCYLHRWFMFLEDWIGSSSDDAFEVSEEVAVFFKAIRSVLQEYESDLTKPCDSTRRAEIVTALSQAGSQYRDGLYATAPSGNRVSVSKDDCLALFETARRHVEATIRSNRREDGLYHAYNLLDWNEQGADVDYLYEMCEGQVAVLSAKLLEPDEVVGLLESLRNSALYRENQNSYLLYPDRRLARFLDKNSISKAAVDSSSLVQKLLADGNEQIVKRDVRGDVHFHGDFRNSGDLRKALERLDSSYADLVNADRDAVVAIFDDVFAHRQFTGRSGTFFGYEGLGSIYWHMVSKLVLAVSENFFWAIEKGESSATVDALATHFDEIRLGVGAEKDPAQYGAFPSDAYSHTPENSGVKQPGMTGQVKEDILSRFAELGVQIEDSTLSFGLDLFDRDELLESPTTFSYCDVAGEIKTEPVPAGGFAYTLFQVPIIYQSGDKDQVEVHFADGKAVSFDGKSLDRETSQRLFSRTGEVAKIVCQFESLE
ncbi:hypothetical protein [Mariniblastus fucicola]|uniref:Cellobiose phosphorylase n=1 Tax=Mariniblastus fucicola TaxID=980251 RepID=A0A5B9P407_9BACT|nr:hypothetical protein [Mariniblastus fucicola]QEG20209.1 hypothetical protein MFFC18_00560 [Mariniblastus fucicola]